MAKFSNIVSTFAAIAAAACASDSGSSLWTQAAWASQAVRDFNQGPYAFSAAPYGEDGFKLTLKLRPGTFGVQSGAGLDDDDLRAAAEAAAPEGCKLKSVTRTETGDAVADYDCA